MPDVTLLMAAAPRPGGHPKATIAGAAGTVTFDRIDPEIDFEALAATWVDDDRPGRRPTSARKGQGLRRITFDARIGWTDTTDRPAVDVTDRLLTLVRLGYSSFDNGQVTIGYSSMESSTTLTGVGAWRIDDLSIRSMRRREGDNAITMASVHLTLVEWLPPATLATPGTSPANPGPPPPAPGTNLPAPAPPLPAAPRRYTVVKGDTLWAIAVRFYGDGNQWRRIATVNNVTDPRTLRVGAVLTIP